MFVFGADGRIIHAVLNVHGSVHDTTLAVWGGTYKKLRAVYERTGAICCVDSAFASQNVPYLIRSAQVNHNARDANEKARMDEATSLRQAAEWGMRATTKGTALSGAQAELRSFSPPSMMLLCVSNKSVQRKDLFVVAIVR
jgi:hypothetical protein